VTLASHGTCWLVSDVLLGSSRAPGSGYDLTGQDIDLNFQIPILAVEQGFEARVWLWTAARLRNRPLLESWQVSLHLAHTKRVSHDGTMTGHWF
jgi:hypothetical protein